MAVSNAIGSDVFDILLGLGIPFAAYCVAWGKARYASGDEVETLVAAVQMLFILLAVVSMLATIKFKPSSRLGASLMDSTSCTSG
jgi:Ca2+/Na+ antiporter